LYDDEYDEDHALIRIVSYRIVSYRIVLVSAAPYITPTLLIYSASHSHRFNS